MPGHAPRKKGSEKAMGKPTQRNINKKDGQVCEPATREQLLDAAGALMIERGTVDISLSEIAEKSGLNSALVKYYFGNKAGLMMALLRRALVPAVVKLESLAIADLAAEQKLRAHVDDLVDCYFTYPYVNRLMHQLMAEDHAQFGPIIATEFSKPVAALQKRILDEGVEQGAFRLIDPLFFYFQLGGACDYLFSAQYQLRHVFKVERISNALRRRFAAHIYAVMLDGILLTPDR